MVPCRSVGIVPLRVVPYCSVWHRATRHSAILLSAVPCHSVWYRSRLYVQHIGYARLCNSILKWQELKGRKGQLVWKEAVVEVTPLLPTPLILLLEGSSSSEKASVGPFFPLKAREREKDERRRKIFVSCRSGNQDYYTKSKSGSLERIYMMMASFGEGL